VVFPDQPVDDSSALDPDGDIAGGHRLTRPTMTPELLI
jgi:hypothetical protein